MAHLGTTSRSVHSPELSEREAPSPTWVAVHSAGQSPAVQATTSWQVGHGRPHKRRPFPFLI